MTLNDLSNSCINLKSRNDYLPVLSLPQHVEEEVKKFKMFCASIIGSDDRMIGKPHITLQDNLMGKEPLITEYQISVAVNNISRNYSIDLEINGFDYFENNTGKTIYMALSLTPLSLLWFNNLKMSINNKKKSFTPHITITKQVSHKAFDLLWPTFEKLQFRATFRADKLTILKRDTFHYISNYRVFKEISFRNEIFSEDLAFKNHARKYLNEDCPKDQQFKLFS